MEPLKVAEIKITYSTNVRPSERFKIKQSLDCYNLFIKMWDKEKIEFVEEFKVMLLNRANKVLGVVDISTGGVSGTVADPKVIFVAALKANASGIVLAHNHPSGNLTASTQDLNLTKKLRAGGEILDISVLDHLILTTEGYTSFADDGLI